jgi:hypothetical protein
VFSIFFVLYISDDAASLPNARKGWWHGAMKDFIDFEEAILNPGELAEIAVYAMWRAEVKNKFCEIMIDAIMDSM